MRNVTLLLLVAAAVPLQRPAGPATTYDIDPGASQVVVHVGKTGLFSFAGHTHEVSAPVADGTVSVDPDGLPRATVRLAFDASALKVTGKGEPAEDVPDVQHTMESAKVLNVSTFPRITFASRQIEVLGRDGMKARLRVIGDLTLHGVTRSEAAEVTATITPARVTAKGTLHVKQTDFGIEPVAAGLGTVRVKDDVEVEFTLVATAREAR